MLEAKPDMVRVNTRISISANKWLDEQSKETGIPKSTLILLAIENYKTQKETITAMSDISSVVAKLEEIDKKLSK